MRRTGKRILRVCPKCGEELVDLGYNPDEGIYEKECIECNLRFTRKKGYGHRWIMRSLYEV